MAWHTNAIASSGVAFARSGHAMAHWDHALARSGHALASPHAAIAPFPSAIAPSCSAIAKWEKAITYRSHAMAPQQVAMTDPDRSIAACNMAIAGCDRAVAQQHHAKAKSHCAIAEPADVTARPGLAFQGRNNTTMRQVKTDLRGLNASEVNVRARTTLNSMKGNPLFPNPTPSMAEFEAACDALNASIIATVNGGDRLAYVKKQERMETVKLMLTMLAAYVNGIAQGELNIALKAGFELRRPSVRITSLEAPRILKARTGIHNGTIDLRWPPVHGARMYRVYIKTGSPSMEEGWEELALTSNSRYQVSDLAGMTYYSFRVEAVGAHATSPASPVATALSIMPLAA